jgi:hypothetical protein
MRTTLRTSGHHVPLKTILHSKHNKQYRIEWVKSKAILIGKNGVRKHFYVLDCSVLHRDGVVCELSHQQQR